MEIVTNVEHIIKMLIFSQQLQLAYVLYSDPPLSPQLEFPLLAIEDTDPELDYIYSWSKTGYNPGTI